MNVCSTREKINERCKIDTWMTLIFLFPEAALPYFQSVWFWLSQCLNQERICDPRRARHSGSSKARDYFRKGHVTWVRATGAGEMAFWHFCLSLCQNKLFSLNESERGGTGATGGSCVHGVRWRLRTERAEGRRSEWRMSLCKTGNPAKTEPTASSCFGYTNIELGIYM